MSKTDWAGWLAGLSWKSVSGEEFAKLPPDEKLKRIRHSTSHVMAGALQSIAPGAVFASGPATAQGFFYDVKLEQAPSPETIAQIQAEMDRVATLKQRFEVATVPKADAIRYFEEHGQPLKVEILGKIPSAEVSLYRHGTFLDLCAGPHVPHTGWTKNSKLLGSSPAHWKKDEKIPSLNRITGTAWESKEDLQKYLELLEEVKARDHRVLGPELDLFSFHPWAASALWHPNGLTLRQGLMSLWRQTISKAKYIEILNPLLYRKDLFETSGHWAHFQDDMFIFRDEKGDPAFVLKPMNCPDTMLFFKSKGRSYRDLPLRVAEGQVLHRNETSGALHGILRTRNFVQDDAHIFLKFSQIQDEIRNLLAMLDGVYGIFGLNYTLRLSTRPKQFMGTVETWDKAEAALKAALDHEGRSFLVNEGDGAFYGPKIDIVINDSLGRDWQCATFQLDFQQPENFDLTFVDEDGSHQRPVVIHRAIFGSFERFIGILVEHFGGAFPTWLAPVQAAVLPISEKHLEYATRVHEQLVADGVRATLVSNESVSYRIRNCETQKVPYMVVVGDREAQNETAAVRQYGNRQQRVLPLADVRKELQDKISARTLDVTVKDYAAFFKSKSHVSTESATY